MRELFVDALGLLVGVLFISFSCFHLVQRLKVAPAERKKRRVGPVLIFIILVIGLADTLKALRDLLSYWQ